MTHLDALGLVAGALTTAAWLPQLVRTWRSRHADDISWGYLGLLAAGITLWLTYGVADHSFSIEAANCVSLFFVVGLLALKAAPRVRGRRGRGLPAAGGHRSRHVDDDVSLPTTR